MPPAGKACLRVLFVSLAFSLLSLPGLGDTKDVKPTVEQRNKDAENRLRTDVTFLASDACEGRGPTTEGLNKAADYIAAEFKKAGLKPGVKGESYFQPFAIPGATGKVVLAGPAGKKIELQLKKQFLPLGSDQNGTATGSVVFAGYGITCKNPAYDDYDGIDVKGKIVVLIRDTPKDKTARSSREMRSQSGLSVKLLNAKKKGAVAVIFVNDAETAENDDTPFDYTYQSMRWGGAAILAVMAQRDVVQSMMPADKNLAEIEKGIDRDVKPNSFEMPGWTVTMEMTRKTDLIKLKNVIGVLEGAGPLAKETVVVGAHYDHGADDNGSGSTSVMELARRFAAVTNRQGRRLVFMTFSGEELGLLGSAYYCNNPIFDLKSTAAMYNLDMVGRLNPDPNTGNAKLLTQGHGTAAPFKELIDGLAKKHNFTLTYQASGFGPSDHASFCGKKIPVLFIWTGLHADYHRPTDTADRINVAGMRRVVDMSEEAITQLTQMEKPAFIEVKGGGPFRPTTGPRLQLKPNYGGDNKGVAVDGVTPGGVADKAGIKAGDIILSLAGKEVKNMTAYTQALNTLKRGSTIEVIVERGGKKMTLKAKLE
jgi:hypothetical protein